MFYVVRYSYPVENEYTFEYLSNYSELKEAFKIQQDLQNSDSKHLYKVIEIN